MKLDAAEHLKAHAMEHLYWICLGIDSHIDPFRHGDVFYLRGTEIPKNPLEQSGMQIRALLRRQRIFPNCRGNAVTDDPDTIRDELGLFQISIL